MIIALTWALLTKRWVIIPLIGIIGALGKETSIPLAFAFCAAWCLGLAMTKSEMLYAFGWLLPLGLFRLRRLPSEWLIAASASLLVALGIGVWFGVTGNASRPAFNAVGPLLSLSAGILLVELSFARSQRGADSA